MECAVSKKLHMDCGGNFRPWWVMDIDAAARQNLIARLFTMLTCRAEDAAGIAPQGQARHIDPQVAYELANRLQDIGQDIATIAEALRAILAINQ